MRKTVFVASCWLIAFVTACNSSDFRPDNATTAGFHYTAPADSPAASEAKSPKDLPELTASSGLEEYLEYASLNNAELEAAFYRWQAALEQIPQAQTLPDPEITFGQYVRQSDMQMNRMVEIMQMFPWFGKLGAQTSVAEAEAQAAAHQLESVRLDVRRQVKKEFYEFLYLKEAIEIAEQNLLLVRHFEQVALAKYITAAGMHPDIIRAQIELADLDVVWTNLKELVKPQTARLNAVLNRPADQPLAWPQEADYTVVDADSEQLTAWLQENNPELKQMSAMIEAARHEIKLAQLRKYPDFGAGLEWTDFEQSGGMSGRDSLLVLFKMNLPIWTDSYKAAERQARANVRAVSRQKQQTENRLAADVASALYELEESRRMIVLYAGIIPKTEQLVSASESAYRADTIDFLSLIDAQRMLLANHLQYRRVQADYQQRLAELEALVGAELKTTETQAAK
jgi:outer membrane protein TolC